MAMPPPSVLDHHDLRGARAESSDGGRFLLHSAYQGQQPLGPLPIRLPNHLLYLQHQHQHQHQQQMHHQQQQMHHQRMISDEDAFRMRQRPLPPPLPQSSSRILVTDQGVEGIGAAAGAAAYRQRLSGTLRGHQSAAFLEPESRWIDREPRAAYSLPGTDHHRLESPVLPYESSLLPDDVVRLRQAVKQSRSFPYHQPQAVNIDHEKVRIADEFFRGRSLADPFSRTRFPVWEAGPLDNDHSKMDSRVHALYPITEKQPTLFLDNVLGKRVADLDYSQPAALYQSRNQENLVSSLPAFRNPTEPVLNKRYREESLHLEREEVRRVRRGSEFGPYARDLTISGARHGRADSAERNYHAFGASVGVETTGTSRQGNTNTNQASLTTNFAADYRKVAGRDSGITLASNDFAAEKVERSIGRKPAKRRVTTSVLSDRSLSPCFRYRSPVGRERLQDEIRSTSEKIERRLSDLGELKRHLEPSRARASVKQTQRSVSIQSRLLAEKDSTPSKQSKKIFPSGSIKSSPKNRGREHDRTLVSQEVGGRHQAAASSKKRLHDKIVTVPTTLGKVKPLKFRKFEQFDGSSKIKAQSGRNVVHLASPHDCAVTGEKSAIKGVESQEIVNQQQQGDHQNDINVQFVSDYQEKVNQQHHCNAQIDKNVHSVSGTKESAQGLNPQLQKTSSGFQLLEDSHHLSELSEKSQPFPSIQPSDVSRIDSAGWKLLEGVQTLDPYQVCVQGPTAICENLCISNNDLEPSHVNQNRKVYPWEDNTGHPVDRFSSDSRFHGKSSLGIDCKQQEYPCSDFTNTSIPDQPSLEMGKSSSENFQDQEVDNGRQDVETLKRMDVHVESLILSKKCESGDFVNRKLSSAINRIASYNSTASIAEARSLEADDSAPSGKAGSLSAQKQSVLHHSKISTTIADSLENSHEQVSSTLQFDADPSQKPKKDEKAIAIEPAHQQHETIKANYSLQTKHNQAISASKLPKFSPCQVLTKKKDSLPLACEKQKSSSTILNLSKPSNEDTAMIKLTGHEQKDDIQFREREEQIVQPKFQVSSVTPKLSSRAHFQKNLQKGSVWSRSPAMRTWHRDNSSSLTGSREVSVSRKAHLTIGQSGEATSLPISTKPASYVRKGNSLVRTSPVTANSSTISSTPLTPPERHSIEYVAKAFPFENSNTTISLGVYSHFLGGTFEQKSGTDAGTFSAVSNQAASQGIVANVLAVPSELPSTTPVEVRPEPFVEQNVSIEITNQRDKLGVDDSVGADKLEAAPGNKLMDDGLHLTFESRQGGNNIIPQSMSRSYVRSKANQLIVAPLALSEYLEDQTGKDGHEKQLQDLYFRKKSNQLVRNSFVSNEENGDVFNNVASRSVSNQLNWERKGKRQVPAMLSTKLGRGEKSLCSGPDFPCELATIQVENLHELLHRVYCGCCSDHVAVLSQKKVLGLRVPLVWTLNGTNKKCQSTAIKGSASSLVPWKKPGLGVGLRSRLLKALPKGRKGSLLSLISRKLQNMRMSQPIYTRSASGFSLHRSGVMSLGGANLKWTKSMEKNSKKAREEATKVVAAVAKERREKKEAVAAAAKARSDKIVARKATRNLKPNFRKRIVLVGLVRYIMDPTKRTLQRLPEPQELSSDATTAISCESLDASPLLTPRRASIGGALYVRVGNGNQLIRDPKTSIRALANEKVRWSLHNVRSRALKKQQYCQFFTRFGKCNKGGGRCPYIHDPEKVAVCTKFLNGTCTNTSCLLTHKVIPERMPDCSFFLQGLCTNECCPYRHVNVNPKAPICEGFLKGYCIDGDKCNKKHTYVCLVYSETGNCPDRTKCKFHHPKKKEKAVELQTGQKIGAKPKRRYFSYTGLASLEAHLQGTSVMNGSMLADSELPLDSECLDFISLPGISHDAEKNIAPMTREELLIFNHPNGSLEDIERLIKPAFVFCQTPYTTEIELI